MTERARSKLMVVLQTVGFMIGVGLLVWVIMVAFSPANREQLAKLGDATPGQVLGLLALSSATITLNGLIFWALLAPERRLRVLDVVATNALATLLAYLPFKMGMISRVVVHTRRDRLPLLLVGAWVVAFAALLAATLAPALAVSLWRTGVDALWWIATIGAMALGVGSLALASWVFAGERGMARLHKLLDPVAFGPGRRLLRSSRFAELHAGFAMLSHPWGVLGATGLRLMDVSVLAGRFLIAAAVLGVAMPWQDAVLLGLTFYMVGSLSPFGEMGAREAATIGLAKAIGIATGAGFAGGDPAQHPIWTITLLVSGTESVVRVVAGGFAVLWLRADRLLRPAPIAGGAEPDRSTIDP